MDQGRLKVRANTIKEALFGVFYISNMQITPGSVMMVLWFHLDVFKMFPDAFNRGKWG